MRAKFYIVVSTMLAAGAVNVSCARRPAETSPRAPRAASPSSAPTPTPSEPAPIAVPANDRTDQLTHASERLLNAEGFQYADHLAQQALTQDPSNRDAQFIRALLAPMMPLRGIMARLLPLSNNRPESRARYVQIVARMNAALPTSTVREFLMDGQPNILREADLNRVLLDVANGFRVLRVFSEANETQELILPAPMSLVPFLPASRSTALGSSSTVTRVDFGMLRQVAAAGELGILLSVWPELGTATAQLQRAARTSSTTGSTTGLIQRLLTDRGIEALRTGDAFLRIRAMGPAAILGAQWLDQHPGPRGATSLGPLRFSSCGQLVGLAVSSVVVPLLPGATCAR